MDSSESKADSKTLVHTAAEAIVDLEHAGKLIGESVRVEGVERVMLVSAIRTRVGEGVDEITLYALADFVPMAFVRVALADSGVTLPGHFGRKDSQGRIREYRRLDDVEIYRDALARGSKAADLEFAPTLLDGPDDACPPLEERPTFPDRPWWLAQWTPKPWWKLW